MRVNRTGMLAVCIAMFALFVAIPFPSEALPNPIISLVDLHFVAPGMQTVPVGSANEGDTVRITSFVGADGSQSWTKLGVVVDNGAPGDPDSWELNFPSVIYDGGMYKMWYSATEGVYPHGTILYATSNDGISWTKYGTVLDYGPPGETQNVHTPAVIKDGSLFRMWYSAYDGVNYRIFQATSPDGLTWTRYGLAIDLGPTGSYDDFYTWAPFALKDGGVYKMWYSASDGSQWRILLATSTDGLVWTKQGLALDVGQVGSLDRVGVLRPSIIYEGGGYHMWYTGTDGVNYRIFYATSPDSLVWIRRGMVIDVGSIGSTEAKYVNSACVLHMMGMPYQMWYTGRGADFVYDKIHYAELTPLFQPMNVWVGFYLDFISPASLLGSDMTQVATASPGTAWIDWIASPSGTHRIYAVIDILNMYKEKDKANNTMYIDFFVIPPPYIDYIPYLPEPFGPVKIGLSLPLPLSVSVFNQGTLGASVITKAKFLNETSAQLAEFDVPPLGPTTVSSRFVLDWISPAYPCTRNISVVVDSDDEVAEGNETNNVYTWAIEVVPGPLTSLVITPPRYDSAKTYVRSFSPLDFAVQDIGGSGVRNTTYRIDGGSWINYTLRGRFTLSGEGEHILEWRSLDFAGNLESTSSILLSVDDTPPETTISPSAGPFAPESLFTLDATDGGSGVARTEYMIDSTFWIVYDAPFTPPVGHHTIWYRSVDNIGNVENEKSLEVKIGTEPPGINVEMNYKPIVASVFTLTLIVVGVLSSKRRPWKGERSKKAVMKAFAATSLPFWSAELVTGLLSLATGILSIPPILGIGTAVDSSILLSGIAVSIVWAMKAKPAAGGPSGRNL